MRKHLLAFHCSRAVSALAPPFTHLLGFFSFVIVLHCLFIRWSFSGSPMPVVITETLLASLKPHALLNHVENPYEDTACGFANISLVNFRPEAIWIFSVVTRRMYMHRLIDNEHWGSVCFMSNARRTSPHPICLEVLIFHIPELDALGFASSSLFRLPLMQLPSNYVEMLLDRWLSWRKARFEVNYIVYRFVFTFMDRVISHGNEMLWGLSMKRRKQFRWPLPFGCVERITLCQVCQVHIYFPLVQVNNVFRSPEQQASHQKDPHTFMNRAFFFVNYFSFS